MSGLNSALTVERLRQFAPVALALAILGGAWLGFVQPRQDAARQAEAEIRMMEPRVAQLSPLVSGPGIPAGEGPAAEVIRRLPQVDPMPDVLERLARLALVGAGDADERNRVSDLLIETGEQATTGLEPPGGPRATRGGEPDPRVALFGVPLAYTRVTVSFESTYERLGRFLWDMRELPTIVEVHALDVEPGSADGRRVRTSMVLFVFRRLGSVSDAALAAARGPA